MSAKINQKKTEIRENESMKVISRVIRYMLHYYKYPFVLVIVCILINAVTTVIGATFPQTLVDDYITPMLANGSKDFSGIAADLVRLACNRGIGVIGGYTYDRSMGHVRQGT